MSNIICRDSARAWSRKLAMQLTSRGSQSMWAPGPELGRARQAGCSANLGADSLNAVGLCYWLAPKGSPGACYQGVYPCFLVRFSQAPKICRPKYMTSHTEGVSVVMV